MDTNILLLILGTALFAVSVFFVLYAMRMEKKINELKAFESKFYELSQRVGETDKEKKEFIDIIMHELNTPLAITSGYLSMILELAKDDLKPKILELVQKSYNSTQHMTEITNQLLTSSEEITGNRPQAVQIEEIVQKTASAFEPRMKENNITLIVKPPKQIPLPLVLADPLSVRKVLSNLLDNSIKFAKDGDGDQVVLSMDIENKEVIISVKDNGVGIPKEAQPRIFDKFFQVDSSHTREVGGTGIGLYNAKQLIEDQGGRIWFESEQDNGTTFFFSLPLAD